MSNAIFTVEVIKTAGAPSGSFWAGNFEERPAELEKLGHRGQLFLVIVLEDGENSVNLVHNFWTELSSYFYQNLSGGILSVLSQAAKLAKDSVFPQISANSLGFVAASVWGKALYLTCFGAAACALVRGGKFSKILQGESENNEIVSASGFLENDDLIFLATDKFFENFPNLANFSQNPLSHIEEELTAKISQSLESEKIAATVIKIVETAKTQSEEVVSFVTAENVGSRKNLPKMIASIFSQFKKVIWQIWVIFFNKFLFQFERILQIRKRSIYLRTEPHKTSRRRVVSIILSILVVVLLTSLSFGIWQRQQRLNLEKFSEFFAKSQSLYEQSVEIFSINRLRARELLSEAQKNLNEAKKFKFEKKKVAELQEKIDLANRESLKLVKIDNPDLIFDLSLVKSVATVTEIEKNANILAFDGKNPTLFTVNLESKTGQITAGGEGFGGFTNFAISGNFAYFLKLGDGVYQLDLNSKELKKVINAGREWGEILDLATFSGNLYLLDGKVGQVWKYAAGASGFSGISPFLKQAGLNFSQATFGIDGFIWVLSAEGRLYQITPSEAKLIEISGLDKPLSSKTILRTTDEAENLYIADLGNSRILVISKSGLYLAQYTSGVFGNLADFAVSEKEGKIYFAQGSKVLEFDLVK